jgi:5'-nucleotidase/UDP-sugar diphosphatase
MPTCLRRLFLSISVLALLFGISLGQNQDKRAVREVTILYTNDFHSAFDPIPAYWLPGTPKLGGAAHLATLIDQIRKREKAVFLFDSGDMFTGMLSNLTKGEALMEMMTSMRYDAMAIGNHEFDYDSENFEKQMNRVPFPVLGANIFYKGTNHRYSRPYTIIERDGVRLGVIGIIGQDARSVANQPGIVDLDFRDPIPSVRDAVKELKGQVDLIVVLAHQGQTGPMQTDAEAHPDLQRDFDEDIKLSGEVPGIDVFVGGHAHRGIETPYVHPKTGTIIVQTYGYGTRLGYLKLRLRGRKLVSHQGELLKVWSDKLPPDPVVAAKFQAYKRQVAPVIGGVLGRSKVRLVRDYRAESLLGSFVADMMRGEGAADIGFQNAGGLRADLPEGAVTKGDVLDALPFLNTVIVCEMTGGQIREVLEQSFSLRRGMMQVSGMRATYDMKRPEGKRLVEAQVAGIPLDDNKIYRVATSSFIANGGDLYETFTKTKQEDLGKPLSEVMMDYIRKQKMIEPPQTGRLVSLTLARPRMDARRISK